MSSHFHAPHWRLAPEPAALALDLRAAAAPHVILGSILVAIACVIIALSTGLVAATPISQDVSAPQRSQISPVNEVLSYAADWKGEALDPFVTLPSGVQVKSSNYNGVPVDGKVYYYSLAPHTSFDPLSRGVLSSDQINVVATVGDPPNRVMVYTAK